MTEISVGKVSLGKLDRAPSSLLKNEKFSIIKESKSQTIAALAKTGTNSKVRRDRVERFDLPHELRDYTQSALGHTKKSHHSF